MFHAWGFAHFGLGLLLGGELIVRRRFDAEATLRDDRRAPARTRRDGAGDGAAHHGAARRDPRALRLLVAAHRRARRLGDPRRPGRALHGRVRRRRLQRLRVDRGRRRLDRRARRTCAPTPRPPGALVPASSVRLLDADGREVPAGEPGRIFVGSGAAFEGYTGGGSKERRRPDGDRRRRAASTPTGRLLDRGPRRRHDRLGRRERLPARGRGRDRSSSTASSRPPSSASTTTSSASGCARSWCAGDGRRARRGRVQGRGQGRARALQGPARRGLPRRAPADVHGQDPQARARRGVGRSTADRRRTALNAAFRRVRGSDPSAYRRDEGWQRRPRGPSGRGRPRPAPRQRPRPRPPRTARRRCPRPTSRRSRRSSTR